MAKKKVKGERKQDDSKLFAFLAVFFTIIGFIIAILVKRENKYVMFYAKQGLVLFIGQIAIGILSAIPILGWFILGPLLWIFWFIIWIIAWVNAISGQMKQTPIIHLIAEKIKL